MHLSYQINDEYSQDYLEKDPEGLGTEAPVIYQSYPSQYSDYNQQYVDPEQQQPPYNQQQMQQYVH